MTLAAAVRQALAGQDAAGLVVADGSDDAATIVACLRGGGGAVVLLLIEAQVAALDRAMLLAAIGPLAIERAPAGRIAAIDAGPGAAEEDVAAAARFLAGARSTTGQVLAIAARGPAAG